jgi:hypothetical protein
MHELSSKTSNFVPYRSYLKSFIRACPGTLCPFKLRFLADSYHEMQSSVPGTGKAPPAVSPAARPPAQCRCPSVVKAAGPPPRILDAEWGADAAIMQGLPDNVPYPNMFRATQPGPPYTETVWVPPSQLAGHTKDELLLQLLHMQGPYPGFVPGAFGGMFAPVTLGPPKPEGGLVMESPASSSSVGPAYPLCHGPCWRWASRG